MGDYDYSDHPATEGVVEVEAPTAQKFVVDNGEKKWVEFSFEYNYSHYRITSADPHLLACAEDVDWGCAWENKGLLVPTKFSVYPSWLTNGPLGAFKLAPMPGCCGVVVSTETEIFTQHRGQGYAKILQVAKEMLARKFGYSMMLATIQMDNIPELVSAMHAGWKVEKTFTNNRTKHLLSLLTKELK
jgi:hypothetical protein